MTYRAFLARDAEDYFDQNVRLYLHSGADWGPRKYLKNDGTWGTAEEGVMVTDAGILLPREAVEVIAGAIEKYLGHTRNHADTEARVLREWLAVEKGRVDRILER